MLLTLGLAVSVRYGTSDADIPGYTDSMRWTEVPDRYRFEPLLWTGLAASYGVLQDERLTLLCADTVGLVVLAFGLHQLKAPAYSWYALILFFPVVLGMQNGLRQYFAAVCFLWSFAIADRAPRRAGVVAMFAVLTHSTTLVMLPLLGARSPIRAVRFAAVLGSIAVAIGLHWAAQVKGEKEVGFDFASVYLAVVSCILIVSLLLDLPSAAKPIPGLEPAVWTAATIVMVGAFCFLSSAWVERIGMFALIVGFIPLCLAIERRRRHLRLCRVVTILSGSVPLVIVPTTRKFVLPEWMC